VLIDVSLEKQNRSAIMHGEYQKLMFMENIMQWGRRQQFTMRFSG
jgi:hypothetical protein